MPAQIYDLARRSPVHACMLRCPFCQQIALRALWAKRHLALSVLPANRPAGSLGKKANAKTAALQRIFSVERMEK